MDESTLNDLLECSVCLERLDTSSKVLPCQHTFCRKCLEVIVSSRQELRCPECRILVDIKIDDLPPNVLLMRILEGMKNAAAAKTQQQLQNHQQETIKIQNDNKVESTLKLNEEQQHQIKFKQLLYYQQQQQQHKQKQQIHLQALQQQTQQSQPPSQNTNSVQTTSAPPQRRPMPHAYALYDFDSNESSDLHFKKGDIILLKRKVDINWYVGELNGIEGTFPTNYVQVIVPLPSPQCIALYDFKMGPNEEEGCLTFKKGTLIHVLRRVDHNWAEGRIGSTIGIFPIAFVELNTLAKQLLDSFVVLNSPPPPPQYQQQQQQQQQQPNTPQNPPNTPPPNTLITQQPRNLPPIPTDANTPDSTSSSSSRSSQTSPNSATNSSCSSSSTSLPSSPNQSNPTSPQNSNGVRYRDCKEKRHSLNALLSNSIGGVGPSLSIVQSNRHSAEILSIPSDISLASAGAQNLRMRSSNDALLSTQTISSASNISTATVPHAASNREPHQTVTAGTSRVNVLKSSGQQNFPPTLPWGYLALYPYKPLKSDELELKKGCVYVVTERCLDGWFKGKNWQDISGVFPGNYVTPLRNRDQQQLMHQWKVVQNHVPLQNPAVQAAAPQSKLHAATNVSHQPPELPPRQSPSSSPASTASASSVWSKPLGQTVEAFFLRKVHNSQEHETISKDKDREKQKDNNGTGSSSAAVSLMKRLTQIKTRSKSPNNSSINNAVASLQQQSNATNSLTYSIDNPTFDDISGPMQQGTAHLNQSHSAMHPVHVRSGSCPSQLLQSFPTDLLVPQKSENNMVQHQHKQQNCSTQITYGSQRVKGCKERPQLQNIRHTADGTFRATNNSNPNNSTIQQQQSVSKCSQQAQQQSNFSNIAIHHRKSQSLDANTISAQMVNTVTDAGRAAPTMPNVRESRFRCVVSYPPNSELELELHVGDIVYVHRKQKHGWYKGTHARTNKTGLFPASFVEPDI